MHIFANKCLCLGYLHDMRTGFWRIMSDPKVDLPLWSLIPPWRTIPLSWMAGIPFSVHILYSRVCHEEDTIGSWGRSTYRQSWPVCSLNSRFMDLSTSSCVWGWAQGRILSEDYKLEENNPHIYEYTINKLITLYGNFKIYEKSKIKECHVLTLSIHSLCRHFTHSKHKVSSLIYSSSFFLPLL